jgi:hypothetical protein
MNSVCGYSNAGSDARWRVTEVTYATCSAVGIGRDFPTSIISAAPVVDSYKRTSRLLCISEAVLVVLAFIHIIAVIILFVCLCVRQAVI